MRPSSHTPAGSAQRPVREHDPDSTPSQGVRVVNNGARSNPRLQVELSRLGGMCEALRRKAVVEPSRPRTAPPSAPPVLSTITEVLELAGGPMRAREIHAAAELLLGRPLLWTSAKGTLAANASGDDPRFRRVRRGVYELAGTPSAP